MSNTAAETTNYVISQTAAQAGPSAGNLSERLWPWTASTDQIVAVAAIASVVVALVTLWMLVHQLRGLKSQATSEARSFQAQMLLDLSKRWTEVLPARYKVMEQLKTENCCLQLIMKAGKKRPYEEFFASEFWQKDLRQVLNFYENLGLLIRQGYLREDEAFVFVSVDTFGGKAVDVENATFYQKIKPILNYLRSGYRPDIYAFYDGWLLPRYCQHTPLIPDGWNAPEASYVTPAPSNGTAPTP